MTDTPMVLFKKLNMKTIGMSIAIALVTMAVSGFAVAEPCQNNAETVKQAVTEVAKLLDERGIEYIKQTFLQNGDKEICGINYVNIISYSRTWVFFPLSPEFVGKTVDSFGDYASVNFFKSLIRSAIGNKKALGSYFTKDVDGEVTRNKSLYYIDVPSRKLVVYGAIAMK